MNQPTIGVIQTASGPIKICSNCQVPVNPPSSYEDSSGRIWRRITCPVCSHVFEQDGPFRTHSEANPVQFK